MEWGHHEAGPAGDQPFIRGYHQPPARRSPAVHTECHSHSVEQAAWAACWDCWWINGWWIGFHRNVRTTMCTVWAKLNKESEVIWSLWVQIVRTFSLQLRQYSQAMKWLLFSAWPRFLTKLTQLARKATHWSKLGTRTPHCSFGWYYINRTHPCVDYEALNPQVLTHPNLMGCTWQRPDFGACCGWPAAKFQGFKDLRLQISAAQPGYLAVSTTAAVSGVNGWHVNDGASDGPYKLLFYKATDTSS